MFAFFIQHYVLLSFIGGALCATITGVEYLVYRYTTRHPNVTLVDIEKEIIDHVNSREDLTDVEKRFAIRWHQNALYSK